MAISISSSSHSPAPPPHNERLREEKILALLAQCEQKFRDFLGHFAQQTAKAQAVQDVIGALRVFSKDKESVSPGELEQTFFSVAPDSPLYALSASGDGQVSLAAALDHYGIAPDALSSSKDLTEALDTLLGNAESLTALSQQDALKATELKNAYTELTALYTQCLNTQHEARRNLVSKL